MRLSLGKIPVIISNSINKTVLLPLCENKCEINRNQSLIVLQKYGSM